jgi:hypothetical protein
MRARSELKMIRITTTEWVLTITIKRCKVKTEPDILEDRKVLGIWQIAMKKTRRKREPMTTPTTET